MSWLRSKRDQADSSDPLELLPAPLLDKPKLISAALYASSALALSSPAGLRMARSLGAVIHGEMGPEAELGDNSEKLYSPLALVLALCWRSLETVASP